MRRKHLTLLIFSLVISIILAACSSGNSMDHGNMDHKKKSNHEKMNMDHSGMNHSGSGKLPKGIKEAKNPTYKVGSQAIMKAGHMMGMNGAVATIVGAYDTTVYAISYTPTTGGKRVTNHKWIVQEEIKNQGDKPYKPGTTVTITADHMKGMNGAEATIDSAENTIVYMVDYTPTTGGEKVKNHKWVTESELSAK